MRIICAKTFCKPSSNLQAKHRSPEPGVRVLHRTSNSRLMGAADLAKFVGVVPKRVVAVLQCVHCARFGEEVAGGLDVVVAVSDRHHVLLHQVVQGDRPPGLCAKIYILPSRKTEKYIDGNNDISYFLHPRNGEIFHRDVLPGCLPPQSRRACFSDPDFLMVI